MASEVHSSQEGRHQHDHHALLTCMHCLATIPHNQKICAKYKQIWYADDTAARVKVADPQVIAGRENYVWKDKNIAFLLVPPRLNG